MPQFLITGIPEGRSKGTTGADNSNEATYKKYSRLIIDVTLYGAALFLEFISLIIFRIKLPQKNRPFKIPLNVAGLCVLILLPMGVYCIALASAFSVEGKMLAPALFALAALFSAELIWQIILWRNPVLREKPITND